MRTLLVSVCLALMALAISPANARYHRHHNYSDRNYREAEARYESCNCYFGYMGSAAGTCSPVTACSSSGGHCQGSCPSQTGNKYY
jgi:hypothetical protein